MSGLEFTKQTGKEQFQVSEALWDDLKDKVEKTDHDQRSGKENSPQNEVAKEPAPESDEARTEAAE